MLPEASFLSVIFFLVPLYFPIYSVMEAIEERRESSKAFTRPKSAPTNSLYRSAGSIDSDFGVSEYFDQDTSNPVSHAAC